jgi:hypothetical protein
LNALLAAVSLGSALAWGWIHPSAGAPAQYQIELRFTGYTGLATSKDCDAIANLAGYDVLTGTVSGIETAEGDEDVVYSGLLKRSTAMDYCQTRGKHGPGDDEVVWCTATLTGQAVMNVEITVYGTADAGAYVKAEPGIGPAQVAVQGNCEPGDMRTIQQDYPGGDSGGSPDGQPIEDAFSTAKFVIDRVPALREGVYKPDPKKGGWRLSVIRKIN